MKLLARIVLCLPLALPFACSKSGGEGAAKKLTIGFSLDTLKEERWQRDRDMFVAECEKLGARVVVQSANNDANLQNSQAENLLTQGVSVLVVVANNAKTAATIVETCHKSGVPVVAYDRLILDSDLDVYVSFDAVRVGELQADYLVKRRPKGRYVLIEGSPIDNNARLVRDGQMNVLKPFVDRGDIEVVAEQWAKDWQPVEALKIMENALTRNQNQVDAVVTANDGMAGGAIQALAEQKLTGKILVSGQDAELGACQRVVAGTQSMTVYKPIRDLARKAAEIAVALGRKQGLPAGGQTIPNGKKDVPAFLIDPVQVDKDNLVSTVVKDGWQKLEDVYKDVPKDQWPK